LLPCGKLTKPLPRLGCEGSDNNKKALLWISNMDIIGTIAALKTATTIAKGIKDSVDALDQAETRFKMAEIIMALADANTNLADIKSELIDRNLKIRDLEDKLNTEDALTFDGYKYWKDGYEHPYCPKCKDELNKLVHLGYCEKMPSQNSSNIYFPGRSEKYRCPSCQYSTTNVSKPT
jgi:hypothetical protein